MLRKMSSMLPRLFMFYCDCVARDFIPRMLVVVAAFRRNFSGESYSLTQTSQNMPRRRVRGYLASQTVIPNKFYIFFAGSDSCFTCVTLTKFKEQVLVRGAKKSI